MSNDCLAISLSSAFVVVEALSALSVFGEIYKFVKAHRQCYVEVILPKSVRQELLTFDGLLPLLSKDLRSKWAEGLSAVDASERGLGMTRAACSTQDVRRLGGVAERWRFKEALPNPRAAAFNTVNSQCEVLPPTVYGLCGDEERAHLQQEDPLFTPVSFQDVNRSWVTTGMHRWRRPITLPVAEARAALYAVKHSLRACGSFGKKHVILSDSMTATLAISRGRSKHYHLRRVCQQVAALALCTGSQFFLRWIPSEMNPSDNPSRGTWAPSVPSREPKEQNRQPCSYAGCWGRATSSAWRTEVQARRESKVGMRPPSEDGASASNHGHASSDGTSAGKRKHSQKGEEGEAQSSAAEHGPLNRRAHGPAAGFRHSGLPNQVQETLGGDKAIDCGESWPVEAGGTSGPGADQTSGVSSTSTGRTLQPRGMR